MDKKRKISAKKKAIKDMIKEHVNVFYLLREKDILSLNKKVVGYE